MIDPIQIKDSHKTTISGHKYTVGNFPAFYNLELAVKIGAVCGDSFAHLFGMLKDVDSLQEALTNTNISMGDLGEVLNKLISSIYVNDPSCEMIMTLMSQTQRDGQEINKSTFNKFYTGNMNEMLKALKFSVGVHFGHLFTEGESSGSPTRTE